MVEVLVAFLACQLFVVSFIALHDWIPLGKLSNPEGIRAADSRAKLAQVTALSTLPYAVGLVGTALHLHTHFPGWLSWLLWISYAAGFYGMLRAWYIPYLFVYDPVRAARYRQRFAGTLAFLPERNGIRPDALHVAFHAAVVATIVLLVCLTRAGVISL